MSDPLLYATIGGVDVWQLGDGTIHWISGMRIDADGSPRAYHPVTERGLDRLANAGRPGNWWGLAVDGAGVPYVQGAHDPAPGYYVSRTALEDRATLVNGKPYAERNPLRYVNSEQVPFAAIPGLLLHGRGGSVRLGALGWARCVATQRESWLIAGDVGPDDAIGEGSIALAQALGIPSDARRGGCPGGVEWWIWPDSAARPRWPRPDAAAEAARRWAAMGR